MRMPKKSRNVRSLVASYYPIGQDFTEYEIPETEKKSSF